MQETRTDTLGWFELPRALVEPSLRALRLGNTALDALFYDVGAVCMDLLNHGAIVAADDGKIASGMSESAKAFSRLDLGALSNPEGSILVVDSGRPPHITPFGDVQSFLAHLAGQGDGRDRTIETLSVTGVGSSALGSVAFAWNIATALDAPVAAIVPGYGVADVVQQGLGGWFGFGMHSLWAKRLAQNYLAHAAPGMAQIGRHLMKTAPGHAEAPTGAPLFRRGSGSSDVLHAILREARSVTRLFGHSKGALVIENAIHELPDATTAQLNIVTFGCTIDEDTRAASYMQFLGLIDGLGHLNSWGNTPEAAILSRHSTNSWLPLSMPVSLLTRIALAQTPEPAAPPPPERLPRIAGPATGAAGLQPDPSEEARKVPVGA